MRRTLTVVLMLGFITVAWASGAQAEPASSQPVLADHAVTGAGSTGNLYFAIAVDARSNASGDNPTGTVSLDVLGSIHVEGPITCLHVDGNQAVIGFTDTTGPFDRLTVHVVDNGATGDLFGALPNTPTDCIHLPDGLGSTDQVLVSGNLTVRDQPALTSKAQCRNRGWQQFTTVDGAEAFTNQGQCIALVVAKNAP
jgi:hypothetical protein